MHSGEFLNFFPLANRVVLPFRQYSRDPARVFTLPIIFGNPFVLFLGKLRFFPGFPPGWFAA